MTQLQPDLQCVEHFYSPGECNTLYERLCAEQNWPDNHYSLGGRQFTLPRLQTWHADDGIVYSYSNNLLHTRPWSALLTEIRVKIEARLNFSFNSVLVNWYRNGEDYVGWHADNEPELGPHPLIASLSLGAARTFCYKHKKLPAQGSVVLRSGCLLIMQPSVQHDWLHAVLQEESTIDGRINMTFRRVLPKTAA